MSALLPLDFGRANVRMIMRDGEPWWVAADIVTILEYHSSQTMTRSLDDDEKGYAEMHTPSATIDGRGGGVQRLLIISLSGLLACTIRSHSPRAKDFRRWVTGRVLPSILRYGCYPPPPEPSVLLEDDARAVPDHEKTIAQRFREERLRIEALTGHQLANIPSMSKQIIAAIENDMGGVTKGQRIRYLALAGVDVLYVLTGRRTIPRPVDRAQLSIGKGCP